MAKVSSEGKQDPFPYLDAAIDEFGFSPDELRVCQHIARRGSCFETNAGIAKVCRIGERTVRLVLKMLVRACVISEEPRIGQTTIYRVNPFAEWCETEELGDFRASVRENWKIADGPGGTGCTPAPIADGVAQAATGGGTRGPGGPAPVAAIKESHEGNPPKEIPLKTADRARASRPKTRIDDDEWIATLEANPLYKGIDIRKLQAKMFVWCEVNHKQPSRRRLVNWLNREESPMDSGKGNGKSNGNGQYKSRAQQAEDNLEALYRERAERRAARENGGPSERVDLGSEPFIDATA